MAAKALSFLICISLIGSSLEFGVQIRPMPLRNGGIYKKVNEKEGCSCLRRTELLPMAPLRGGTDISALNEGGGLREAHTLVRFASEIRVVLAKNTRWLVAGTAATVLLYRRDALTVSALVGAILNAAWSKILKRLLNENRPEGAPVSDPGMPSSHAMSLFFFAAYLSMAAALWSPTGTPMALRAAECVVLLAFAINSASWRVDVGLHTRDQVLVGSMLGFLDGLLWFWATQGNWDLLVGIDHSLGGSDAMGFAVRCAHTCRKLAVSSLSSSDVLCNQRLCIL